MDTACDGVHRSDGPNWFICVNSEVLEGGVSVGSDIWGRDIVGPEEEEGVTVR